MARDGMARHGSAWHDIAPHRTQVQEIPDEETALRERVHGILLTSNGGNERMTPSAASEILYNAGLGLRYVQVSCSQLSF